MESFQPPPLLQDFADPIEFVRARIEYRRATQPGFSIVKECQQLRRCSPALVSMILKKQRPLSIERIEDLSKIMGLRFKELLAFKDWVFKAQPTKAGKKKVLSKKARDGVQTRRREVSHHLLADWLHPYVKDAFRFEHLQKNSDNVARFLGNIASPQRIRKSLEFLLREGYLRRTLSGKIVEEVSLTVADSGISNKKVREFHKKALQFAIKALDLFSPERRLANTLVLSLSRASHAEVVELIEEFAHKLQDFAETDERQPEQLFQLIINLCPVGTLMEISHAE